jgi:hypothetical protein
MNTARDFLNICYAFPFLNIKNIYDIQSGIIHALLQEIKRIIVEIRDAWNTLSPEQVAFITALICSGTILPEYKMIASSTFSDYNIDYNN